MSEQNGFYCSYCDCTLLSKEMYQAHCTGKKHKVREKVVLETDAARRTLYVGGLNAIQNKDEFLQAYFLQFGAVKSIRFTPKSPNNCAFVEVGSETICEKMLAKGKHTFRGYRFFTKKYKLPPSEQKRALHIQEKLQEKETRCQNETAMLEMLSTAVDIEDQMHKLVDNWKLTPEEEQIRAQICNSLNKIFSPHFEACSVHQFGSSVNRFGMRGCDLDLFLDILSKPSKHFIKGRVNLPYCKDIKSLKADHGPLTLAQISAMTLYDRVKFVARILTSQRSHFTGTITIPSSRCPVVKFSHELTGLKCDLSLNNRKAVHNSYLLRLYGSDSCVLSVVSVVRHWAKVHELSGGIGAGHLFTSYALTFIVIFYIMTRIPKILPTVTELLDCIEGAYTECVDEWECVVIPSEARLPPSENEETEVQLLQGFFEFCSESVNWENTVLITRDASFQPLAQIQADSFYSEFKPGFMSVMDPFVLTHNITSNVNEKTKNKFIYECKRAANIVKTWLQDGPSNNSEPWGIAALFIRHPESEKEIKMISAQKSGPRIDGEQPGGEFVMFLTPTASVMSNSKLASLATSGNTTLERQWYALVQNLAVNVMKTVFLVDMQPVKKQTKKPITTDVHNTDSIMNKVIDSDSNEREVEEELTSLFEESVESLQAEPEEKTDDKEREKETVKCDKHISTVQEMSGNSQMPADNRGFKHKSSVLHQESTNSAGTSNLYQMNNDNTISEKLPCALATSESNQFKHETQEEISISDDASSNEESKKVKKRASDAPVSVCGKQCRAIASFSNSESNCETMDSKEINPQKDKEDTSMGIGKKRKCPSDDCDECLNTAISLPEEENRHRKMSKSSPPAATKTQASYTSCASRFYWCCCSEQVWVQRRAVRQSALRKSDLEGIALERKITQHVLAKAAQLRTIEQEAEGSTKRSSSSSSSSESVLINKSELKFSCCFIFSEGQNPSVSIRMKPCKDSVSQFRCFFSPAKSMIIKLASGNLFQI